MINRYGFVYATHDDDPTIPAPLSVLAMEAAFDQWLRRMPDHVKCGYPYDPHRCPLGRFLLHHYMNDFLYHRQFLVVGPIKEKVWVGDDDYYVVLGRGHRYAVHGRIQGHIHRFISAAQQHTDDYLFMLAGRALWRASA